MLASRPGFNLLTFHNHFLNRQPLFNRAIADTLQAIFKIVTAASVLESDFDSEISDCPGYTMVMINCLNVGIMVQMVMALLT